MGHGVPHDGIAGIVEWFRFASPDKRHTSVAIYEDAMKVVLINTPFVYLDSDDVRHSQCVGLRYISSYLRKHGISNVTLIDGLREGFHTVTPYGAGYVRGLRVEQILDRTPIDADLVGLSVPYSQLALLAHSISSGIKRKVPNAMLVMGGVYPSTSPEHALSSDADLVVVGEGEEALLALARGVPASRIKGVYQKENGPGAGREYESGTAIEELDVLPFPDYLLPRMDTYFEQGQRAKEGWGRTATIITSRGCTFDCEFCSIHPVCGSGWRSRSADNVLAEMKYVIERFGITRFEIEDDNFTLNAERAHQILEGMIRLRESGYPLQWRVPNGVRIDTVESETIGLFKRANCRQVILALEHGSPDVLKIMNKRLSLDKAYEVAKGFVDVGLEAIGLFVIVGYPGETREHFEASVEFLEKLSKLGGNLSAITSIAQPYPGTRLLGRCLDHGFVQKRDIEDFFSCKRIWNSASTVIANVAGSSPEEILQRVERVKRVFVRDRT